jgi:hypothetical protein
LRGGRSAPSPCVAFVDKIVDKCLLVATQSQAGRDVSRQMSTELQKSVHMSFIGTQLPDVLRQVVGNNVDFSRFADK